MKTNASMRVSNSCFFLDVPIAFFFVIQMAFNSSLRCKEQVQKRWKIVLFEPVFQPHCTPNKDAGVTVIGMSYVKRCARVRDSVMGN
jgi:hypothetical protein